MPEPVRAFYSTVMKRKDDDHHASHNDTANQYLHLVSSSIFIYCYLTLFVDLTTAMFLGIGVALPPPVRSRHSRAGVSRRRSAPARLHHAKQDADSSTYFAIPLVAVGLAGAWSVAGFVALADTIALQWFLLTLASCWAASSISPGSTTFGTVMVWFVKLVTDPFTDVITYFPRRTQRA